MPTSEGLLALKRPAPAAAASGTALLALLSCGHFFIDMYSGALGALQPLLVVRHGLSLTQAGILGGLYIFSNSVCQPLYGMLSDRLRSRLFTVLAPGAAGLFISSLINAPSYGWVIALALLGGAGIASFHPQATSWATHGIAQSRGRWMAIFISSGTFGLALGPTYFSFMPALVGMDRLYLAGIPGLACTVMLWLLLPSAPERTRSAGSDFGALRAVWRPLALLYFLVFIRSIVQITYTHFLPLYLHLERGYSLAGANYTLSAYLAFGALGGFAGGHLADRLGGRKVIMLSMAGCVPFLALFFFGSGMASIAGLLGGGLVLLFTIPVNVVMAQELAPGQKGTVSALMMGFAWGVSGLVFIPLTGWLADMYSIHTVLMAEALFPLIGLVLAWKLPEISHG